MRLKLDDSHRDMLAIAFGSLLGRRGQDARLGWHADVFRTGDIRQLGVLMAAISSEIVSRTPVSVSLSARGSITEAVTRLNEVGELMQAQPEGEEEQLNYHWILIGELVAVIAALLGETPALAPAIITGGA